MMDPIWQATLEGYVKLLYDNDPQGPLLESIHDFEDRFCRLAEENKSRILYLSLYGIGGIRSAEKRDGRQNCLSRRRKRIGTVEVSG